MTWTDDTMSLTVFWH